MTEEELCGLVSDCNAGQNDKEAWFFWEAAKKVNPKVVVEIGIYGGGNLKVLSTLVEDKDGLVIGMDYDWSHWSQRKWELSDCICPAMLLDGDSHLQETLYKLRGILGGRQIDVLFIDGDHSCAGALMDYNMYSPLVRTGGIIGVHDLVDGGSPGQNEMGEFNVKGAWARMHSSIKKEFYNTRADGSINGFGIGYLIKE